MSVNVSQARGRHIASGFGGTSIQCTGSPQTVEVIVTAQQGAFKKGTALVQAFVSACEGGGFPIPPSSCVSDQDIEEVQISS